MIELVDCKVCHLVFVIILRFEYRYDSVVLDREIHLDLEIRC